MATTGSLSVSVLDMEEQIEPTTRPHAISRQNKAMAAISSAAVTSLLMTPFDVIKTRMQTQAAPETLFQPSAKATSSAACCQAATVINQDGAACRFDPRLETKAGISSRPAAAAFGRTPPHVVGNGKTGPSRPRSVARVPPQSSPMSGAACVYPDRKSAARELQQLQNNGRLSGLWDGVMKVGRKEGIRGLWRGLTPTLVMTVPSQLTYMTCYDTFRTSLLAMGPEAQASTSPSLSNLQAHHLFASMASGALARSVSATLVTPIELVRTRLQASSTSHDLSTLFANLSREVKQRGPRVLFRGLVPTLYRDVPFSALYFTGYESMKRVLTGVGFGERHMTKAGEKRGLDGKDFAVAFVSGATSGSVAAVLTHPFDLIKTRLQAVGVTQASGSTVGTTATTTLQVWRQIVASEGAKGLFRGLSPRVAKVAPACGVMISSFELVARWLDDRS